MVLVASADNRRLGDPPLDMHTVFSSGNRDIFSEWVTTFNNERCHELIVSKEDPTAKWRSLARVRGYVYPVAQGGMTAVTVSGSRCPIHNIEYVKSM